MDVAEYKPMFRWVMVSPISNQVTEGGIYKPVNTNKETVEEFLVEAVGDHVETVIVGDKVLLEQGRLVELPFKKDGKLLLQVMEQQIIGRFRKEKNNTKVL